MKRFLRWLVDLVDNTSTLPPQKKYVAPLNTSSSLLQHWQGDDDRVNWARSSDQFAEILSIYESLRPGAYPLRGQSITEIQAAVELGRHEGYADGRAVLLALREFPAKPVAEVQADYTDGEDTEEES